MAMASTKETIIEVGAETDKTYSEAGQPLEQEDHPLLNDVVLQTLFKFMRGRDLKECRLVCKKWCELTLPSARSKFSVNLRGNTVEVTKRLTDFLEVFRHNKLGIPFGRYNLDPFCTREGPGQEFLQVCGSTAKTVSLVESRNQNPFTFEIADVSELLKAMPNIELFCFDRQVHFRSGNVVKLFPDDSSTKPALNFLKKLVVWDVHKPSEQCSAFIEEISSMSPNISDIELHSDEPTYTIDRSKIGLVLNAIEKLAKKGLKLKNFDLILHDDYYHGGEVESTKFLPLLAKLFKNSIERLVVHEVCSSFIQFPYMPKLERLEFLITRDFDSNSVNLNKLFPTLKELDLYDWGDGLECEPKRYFSNCEPCPNVKSLSLGGVAFKMEVFDHMLNTFPKLTELELHIKTDVVQILTKIMTQMSQLESLSVWFTIIEGIENLDAFFTGIPVQKVEELKHVVTELKGMTAQLRAETIRDYRTQYCQSPAIANLTNLKRLELHIIHEEYSEGRVCASTHFTDVFLFFGLHSMKHINQLGIWYTEFTKISCEILIAEMGGWD